MSYYKSYDENEADFWIILIGGLFILFSLIIIILVDPNLTRSQATKKDPESTYTVISSDGTRYSNLTKESYSNRSFITKEGKTICFTGNHTTIEE